MIKFFYKYCLYIHKGNSILINLVTRSIRRPFWSTYASFSLRPTYRQSDKSFDKMEFFYLLLDKDRRIFFNPSLF